MFASYLSAPPRVLALALLRLLPPHLNSQRFADLHSDQHMDRDLGFNTLYLGFGGATLLSVELTVLRDGVSRLRRVHSAQWDVGFIRFG